MSERRASRILTDQQLDEMARLRERGWGIDRIAAHFTGAGTPVSASTIEWQCMRLGADAPVRFRGSSPKTQVAYDRGGHAVRPWTAAEDADLLRLEGGGIAYAEICRRLDRASSSVRGRLLTLARREARAEDLRERRQAA